MKQIIIEKVIEDCYKQNKSKVEVDYSVLSFTDFKELLIEVYANHVCASDELMMSSYEYWKNFSYAEWLNILKDYSDYVEIEKKGVFGFETFMKFFYIVLEIDLFSVYAESSSKNEKLKKQILITYTTCAGLLCDDMGYYVAPMKLYQLEKVDFISVKKRLLEEGAYEAEVIDAEKYIEDRHGFKMFFIQTPPPPKSWKWVEDYK